MHCLVTGGAGFIGSHLADRLIKKGHLVSVVDDLSRGDDLSTGKLINIPQEAKFYKIKIESPKLKEVYEKTRPEIIFHLAAQSQVKKSVDNPFLDVRTNILGTLNLILLSLKYKAKKFIFSSSGGVIYGNTARKANENTPLNPISPYGFSKLAGEQYIKFYSQYGLKYSILRYSNVYGPRQDPNGEAGVVAVFTKHMLKNEPCILYGFGKPIRDYVYVEDVVQANVIASQEQGNEIINIGTGIPTSVSKLFDLMSRAIGYSLNPVYKPLRGGELDKNLLDWSRAKELLGWEPKTSLKNGLEQTINWFKEVEKS